MLKLQNLSKSFGKAPILAGLTYTFPEKGMIALMGPSGCGKTTLFRLISGLERPDGGSVQNTYTKTSVSFQEPRLLPWATAWENLTLVLPENKDRKKLAWKYLADMELEASADLLPAELSGGMKSRLSLARALAYGGDLLLLDEPFTGLDEILRKKVADVIRAANTGGLTIVVTHSEEEAALLGAKILSAVGTPFYNLHP